MDFLVGFLFGFMKRLNIKLFDVWMDKVFGEWCWLILVISYY